jgi:alcohol dehydrogenase class IV
MLPPNLLRVLPMLMLASHVGVSRDAFPAIARKALGDVLTKNNPRTVRSTSDIEEVLELAW